MIIKREESQEAVVVSAIGDVVAVHRWKSVVVVVGMVVTALCLRRSKELPSLRLHPTAARCRVIVALGTAAVVSN